MGCIQTRFTIKNRDGSFRFAFKQRAIVHLWKGYIEFGDYPNGYVLVRSKETTDAYKEIGQQRGFANGSLNQDLDIFAECAVTFIGLLTLYMKYGDKHPVEVVPVKPHPKLTPLCNVIDLGLGLMDHESCY